MIEHKIIVIVAVYAMNVHNVYIYLVLKIVNYFIHFFALRDLYHSLVQNFFNFLILVLRRIGREITGSDPNR